MEPVQLEPPDSLAMPLGEAMFTQRAIRRLDPDRPIEPDKLLAAEMVSAPAVVLAFCPDRSRPPQARCSPRFRT